MFQRVNRLLKLMTDTSTRENDSKLINLYYSQQCINGIIDNFT